MNTELNEYIKTLTAIRDGAKWEAAALLSPRQWYPAIGDPIATIRAGHQIRIKPWTLGRSVNGFTLADGQEWHRYNGWKEEWLPDGWRPFLDGEKIFNDDEFLGYDSQWTVEDKRPGGADMANPKGKFYRTRRPLPASDPLADIKAAHAAGQTIQRRVSKYSRGGDIEWSKWVDQEDPSWVYSEAIEWRIKPAPVMVPLGPDDVPPGSVIRLANPNKRVEWMPAFPVDTGVEMPSDGEWSYLPFIDMRERWQINRSIPLTGRWDKDAWQPCEKEEAQP